MLCHGKINGKLESQAKNNTFLLHGRFPFTWHMKWGSNIIAINEMSTQEGNNKMETRGGCCDAMFVYVFIFILNLWQYELHFYYFNDYGMDFSTLQWIFENGFPPPRMLMQCQKNTCNICLISSSSSNDLEKLDHIFMSI